MSSEEAPIAADPEAPVAEASIAAGAEEASAAETSTSTPMKDEDQFHVDPNDPRFLAAQTIRPGWAAVPLKDWNPHKHKPQFAQLVAEAQRRLPGLKCKNWPVTKIVDWLAANGDDGSAVNFPRVSSDDAAAHAAAGGGKGAKRSGADAFGGGYLGAAAGDADERLEMAARRRRAELAAEAEKDQLVNAKMLSLEQAAEKLAACPAAVDPSMHALLMRRKEQVGHTHTRAHPCSRISFFVFKKKKGGGGGLIKVAWCVRETSVGPNMIRPLIRPLEHGFPLSASSFSSVLGGTMVVVFACPAHRRDSRVDGHAGQGSVGGGPRGGARPGAGAARRPRR